MAQAIEQDVVMEPEPERAEPWWQGWLAPALLLVCVTAVVTAAFWPGTMSSDTITQLGLLRSGALSDWHAGLLIGLWRPLWEHGLGVGPVFVLVTAAFVVGMFLLLRTGFGRLGAAILTTVVVLLPQVLGYLVNFGRDAWFTASLLLAAGLIVVVARRRHARWPIALFVIVVWIMVATRQNALPVVLPLGLGLLDAAGDRLVRAGGADRAWGRVRRWGVRTAVVLAALAVIVVSQQGLSRALGVRSSHPEQATFIYDLAAMSARRGEVLFSPEVYPAQDLAPFVRVFTDHYGKYTVDPIVFGSDAPIPIPVPSAAYDALRDDWFDAVIHHPLDYLAVRGRMWLNQIAWSHPTWQVYHPGIDPNPLGYRSAFPVLVDDIQSDWLDPFTSNQYQHGTIVHLVWVYLLAVCAGTVHLRSADPARRVLGWLCVAALLYAATLFVGTMGVQYRYTYPVVVVSLPVIAVGARDLWRSRRRKRAGRGVAVPASEP